jgi:two-component system, LytTR family, response regulator
MKQTQTPACKQVLATPDALLLPFLHGRQWVKFGQIVRLEGVGNYTNCVFADGSHLLVALTLKRLHNRIPADAFVRPHRKHLINRLFITQIHASNYTVDLSNGDCIAIARRRASAFMQGQKAVS